MDMKKHILNVIRKYMLLLLLPLMMAACEKVTNVTGGINEDYEPVGVTVGLSVSGYKNQERTRASQILPGDMGNEENAIHNITVFQFDGNGDDTNPLVVLRYINSGLDALVLGLMQPKSDPDKDQFLYFVANTGDQLQNFTGVYGDLKQKLISVNDAGIADGTMVMTASLVTTINALQPIQISFNRKLAKINVTCSIADGVNFIPARVQLRNVPKALALGSISSIYPMGDANNFQNYLSVADNIMGGYTWYMPENLRGIGTATDHRYKTASTAPSGQGDYCTYIELSGLYQESGTSKLVSYKVYLGGNNTNDYNVEANRIYNVNLSVKGVNEVDSRLTVVTLPEAETPANCYMILPGTTMVIDMLKPPGTAVPASGVDYATRVGSASAGTNNIKSIGIVWQTEDTPDGLIQDLTFLEATGQAMFKATPGNTGNLLLAAYSEPEQQGTILWSWHVWVTDYDPGIGDAIGDVPGGKVHSISADGAVWMDRDLGALTATPGKGTTLGYAYQWGRKDPFPMSSNISASVLRPLYDAKGKYLRSGVAVEERNSAGQLIVGQSISEPWVFYTNTVTNHSTGSGYWWGGSSINIYLWSDGVKTMYDPCPAGWRLPTGTIVGKMKGNTMQSWSGTDYGAYYRGTSWYQYYGYLLYNTGTIGQTGQTGVYWSSAVRKMYQLDQYHTNIDGGGIRDCDYGFIGRCIKDTTGS